MTKEIRLNREWWNFSDFIDPDYSLSCEEIDDKLNEMYGIANVSGTIYCIIDEKKYLEFLVKYG